MSEWFAGFKKFPENNTEIEVKYRDLKFDEVPNNFDYAGVKVTKSEAQFLEMGGELNECYLMSVNNVNVKIHNDDIVKWRYKEK